MLTYDLSQYDCPLYEALYRAIKDDIRHGNLKKGERLPSKRTLSNHLNISLITIENAYHQLMLEGYIIALPKKGYYVKEIELSEKRNGYHKTEEKEEDSHYDHNPLFPFDTWARLTRKVLGQREEKILSSIPFMGYIPLRKAIARHLRNYSGIETSYHNIFIGAGSQIMYNLLIQLFGKDCSIALEDPGYDRIRLILEANGLDPVYIPLDEEGVDIKELSKHRIDVLHLSPAHQYPTGITTTAARRSMILKWAREHKTWIIEDDYDNEFRLNGRPIPPIYQSDSEGRTIYMNTFTNTLSQSFRISYMVLPDELLKTFREKLSFYSCTVSLIDQMVLTEFIESGHFERHISRTLKYYRDIHDALVDILKTLPGVSIIRKDSGLHFLLRYKGKDNETEMAEKARKEGIRLDPLSSYYSDHRDTHTLVFSFSNIRKEDLTETKEKLKRIFK